MMITRPTSKGSLEWRATATTDLELL